MMRVYHICVSVIIALSLLIFSCNGPETIRIIHAGSLSVPVREAADSFEVLNPGVRVLTEAWGSKAGARRISDLDVPCDIFISADYKVIENFLIPLHASWYIPFAGNEMAIVYNPGSRYSREINRDNWYNILLRDEVIFGRSDPDSDPCGVRTVLLTLLAGIYYDQPGLSASLLMRHHNMIRPKETDLIALLETNSLDYIFLYRSVAEQHRLSYLLLPDSLNLKSPELNQWYSRAVTEVRGVSPGEVITERGEAMVYGITIPHKTSGKTLSEAFVSFFLSEGGGLDVLERNGQHTLIPSYSSTFDHIPESLRSFALGEK